MVKSAFDMFYEEIGLIDKSKGENQNITDLPNENIQSYLNSEHF